MEDCCLHKCLQRKKSPNDCSNEGQGLHCPTLRYGWAHIDSYGDALYKIIMLKQGFTSCFLSFRYRLSYSLGKSSHRDTSIASLALSLHRLQHQRLALNRSTQEYHHYPPQIAILYLIRQVSVLISNELHSSIAVWPPSLYSWIWLSFFLENYNIYLFNWLNFYKINNFLFNWGFHIFSQINLNWKLCHRWIIKRRSARPLLSQLTP